MTSSPGSTRSAATATTEPRWLAPWSEWSSLERDPLNHEILSPFINREVAVSVERVETPGAGEIPGMIAPDDADAALRYDVSLDFNGPLFLASFFIPVLIFHGVGALWRRKRSG